MRANPESSDLVDFADGIHVHGDPRNILDSPEEIAFDGHDTESRARQRDRDVRKKKKILAKKSLPPKKS